MVDGSRRNPSCRERRLPNRYGPVAAGRRLEQLSDSSVAAQVCKLRLVERCGLGALALVNKLRINLDGGERWVGKHSSPLSGLSRSGLLSSAAGSARTATGLLAAPSVANFQSRIALKC